MRKKFIKAYFRCDGVKEEESWTKEYLQPIQDFVDNMNKDSSIDIYDIGLNDEDTLLFLVEFYGSTKKECESLFTLFKVRLKELLKSYGLKEIVVTFKCYGDKI